MDGKFETTKRQLEVSFEKWGLRKFLSLDQPAAIDQAEQLEPPKKLNPTERLKQQLREKEPSSRSRSTVFQEPGSEFKEETERYEAIDADAPEKTDLLQWWKHHANARFCK